MTLSTTPLAPGVAVAGFRIVGVMSAQNYALRGRAADPGHPAPLARALRDRWTDFAGALAACPEAIEILVVLGSQPAESGPRDEVVHALLAVGRAATPAEASAAAVAAAGAMRRVALAHLDFIELAALDDAAALARVASLVAPAHATELSRRVDCFALDDAQVERRPLGFVRSKPPASDLVAPVGMLHLVPWTQGNDSWAGLVAALDDEPGVAALVVHARTVEAAPSEVVAAVRAELTAAEQVARQRERPGAPVHGGQEVVVALKGEILARIAVLSGPLLAVRVFLAASQPPSSALVAVAVSSIDEADIAGEPRDASLFRGGAEVDAVAPGEVLASLAHPSLAQLFSPREAVVALRTVAPGDDDYPGLPALRARTGLYAGVPGNDQFLGRCQHAVQDLPVQLDYASRFRHAYVIGQTGTGKSTLLSNCILHDVRAGRGVVVIDPHGSLVEDVLRRVPRSRVDDVVVIDPTDRERPLPFNFLCIEEDDPAEYVRVRDLVADDLLAYFRRTYPVEMLGPMFETYFQTCMVLMMGVERPRREEVPNVLWIYKIFQDSGVRKALLDRVKGRDAFIDLLVEQMENATYDSSMASMAPYVTSKFTRFAADTGLRRMTCQPGIIDIGGAIESKKILLFDLGRGRVGEHASGLLTSMILSRIWGAVRARGAEAGAAVHVYVDEFQAIADLRFAEMLAEARKFRLALTLAHQYTEQVPSEVLTGVLGNVGTSVIFRVGHRDGETLGPALGPRFGPPDLTSLPNYHALVRTTGSLGTQPFSLRAAPPPAGGDVELSESLRELSRLKYGRAAELVDAEIVEGREALNALGEDDPRTRRRVGSSIF